MVREELTDLERRMLRYLEGSVGTRFRTDQVCSPLRCSPQQAEEAARSLEAKSLAKTGVDSGVRDDPIHGPVRASGGPCLTVWVD